MTNDEVLQKLRAGRVSAENQSPSWSFSQEKDRSVQRYYSCSVHRLLKQITLSITIMLGKINTGNVFLLDFCFKLNSHLILIYEISYNQPF